MSNDTLLLLLAKANQVRRVLLPAPAAGVLRGFQQKQKVRLGGVEVVEVNSVQAMVTELWGRDRRGEGEQEDDDDEDDDDDDDDEGEGGEEGSGGQPVVTRCEQARGCSLIGGT